MVKHATKDSASVNFSINVPPSIIREYFDGLAKVETAKHKVPESKGFDWSSLIPLVVPFVTPLITKSLESSPSETKIRVPERKPTVIPVSQESDSHGGVVIAFSKKPVDEDQEKSEEETPTCEKKEEPEEPEEPEDCTNVKEWISGEWKPVDVKQEKNTKKPSYEEGDNIMEFSFGTEERGNIGEMMKMLGPMLKGLTSELNVFGNPAKPSGEGSKTKDEETEGEKEEETKEEKSFIDLMTNALDGSDAITDCDDLDSN